MANWWDKFYNELSIYEISWDSGMTEEEVEEEMDSLMSAYEGYSIAAYIAAIDEEYEVLSDAGLENLLVVEHDGVPFLANVIDDQLYDVTDEVREVLCLDDDLGDDIEGSENIVAYDDLDRIERQYGCYAEYQRSMQDDADYESEKEARRYEYYAKCKAEEDEAIANKTFFVFPSDDCYTCKNFKELGMTGPEDDFPKGTCPYFDKCSNYNDTVKDSFYEEK